MAVDGIVEVRLLLRICHPQSVHDTVDGIRRTTTEEYQLPVADMEQSPQLLPQFSHQVITRRPVTTQRAHGFTRQGRRHSLDD